MWPFGNFRDLIEKGLKKPRHTKISGTKVNYWSKLFTILPEAPCSSVSSANRSSITMSVPQRISCALREFIPSVKEVITRDETNESFANTEIDDGNHTQKTNGTFKASKLENPHSPKSVQTEKTDGLASALTINEMQGNQNYPRHITVHVVDGNLGSSTQSSSRDMLIGGVNGQPNPFANSAASNTSESQNNTARSSVHQSFPSCPPFAQHNQEDYQSFLHMSSAFSSLIVSTLLQNPAAHAAASFAATFWPYANAETSVDSPACSQGGFPSRQIGSPPSVAAIAAATVAAATAWWSAHGLLPLCAPLHTAQHSAAKSPAVSSSESEESEDAKLNNSSKATTNNEINQPISENPDSNKMKGRKQTDRSSCGSNTTSSSEETEALEKDEKEKEDSKIPDANQLAIEPNNRRSRSISNVIDSWKEVSEEGRLAFHALFSREVLPQSFSPPHDVINTDHQMDNMKDNKPKTDYKDLLDSKKCSFNCDGMQKNPPFVENNEEGLLTIGLGQGKLKTHLTGFKPYKRCLVEAKENRMGTACNQVEETVPKRIRLEGETST